MRYHNKEVEQHILVVGDFMIDQEWVLSGIPSPTSQAHGDINPMRRIHPTWNDKRAGGGGYGTTSFMPTTGFILSYSWYWHLASR